MNQGESVNEKALGSNAGPSTLEDRLTAILDHAADAIIVADDQGVVEGCNKAAAIMFGWSADEMFGQNLEVLMGGDEKNDHANYLKRYLATGRSGIVGVGPRDLQARHRDGSPIFIELSVGEAWMDGRRKFIGACRDITERIAREDTLTRTIGELRTLSNQLEAQREQSDAWARAAEAARAEAENSNLAKSRFLSTMSHEIRTPLNGVIAVADILVGRIDDAKDRELAEIIRESGRTLLAILNDILDLSKIEAGAASLVNAPLSLADLVGSLVANWRPAGDAKGLALVVETAGLPRVIGDEARLRQILANLLSNSIKFTERGSVAVRGACKAIGGDKVQVELTVIDTGQGFDSALAERVFDPFVQVDDSNTRRHGGTGLGLAICRELVELMGGEIKAVSAPGVGTCITVSLKMTLAADERADATASPLGAIAHFQPSLRVLVAEDHPLNCLIFGMLLEEMGISHEIVNDGAAVVQAVAKGRFDIVLMDIHMPGTDGLEATRMIRRLPGQSADIPIIAVTASAMTDASAACKAAGMNDFLAKPIHPAELQQMLVKHLSTVDGSEGST